MKFHQKSLFLFFLILPSWPISAQDYDDFIEGVLLDSKSREPIVFATIRIKGKALGVISNQDGGFRIPLEFQEKGEELEISSMGYNTYTVLFDALETNGLNRILLQPALFQLQETIVTATKKRLTSKEIIQKALNRIPDNYENNPFELIGYYRDYQIKNKKYSNLNEAIIKVFDGGFKNDNYLNTEYGIYAYSKNYDFEIDSFAAKPYDYNTRDKYIPDASLISDYGGNELVILHIHDAIRNHNIPAYSFVGKLVDDFIKSHRFSKVEQTSYNNKAVCKIAIKKRPFPFLVEGFIYIDKDDYSIRRLDYAVYRKYMITQNGYSSKAMKERQLLYEIIVEYGDYENKMFLNYISFHNKFSLKRPAQFRIQKLTLDKVSGVLGVELNKPAANYDNLKLSDIYLMYKGKQLKFKKIVAISNQINLKLSNSERQVLLRNELFADDAEKEKIILRISGLVDQEGNVLDERKTESLDQFREFFTQKILVEQKESISKNEIMLKKMPLYNKEQNMLGKGQNYNYWMNTPLKEIKQ